MNPTLESKSGLYGLPEVVRVEEFRKLGIDVDHVHISFFGVPNDRFAVVASVVRLNVNPKRSVYFQLKSVFSQSPILGSLCSGHLSLSHCSIVCLSLPPGLVISLHALHLQVG